MAQQNHPYPPYGQQPPGYPPVPTLEGPPGGPPPQQMPPAMTQAGYPGPPPQGGYADPYGNLHPGHPYNYPPQNHTPDYDLEANAEKIGSHESSAEVRHISFTRKGFIALLVFFGIGVFSLGFFSGYVAFEPVEDFIRRVRDAW